MLNIVFSEGRKAECSKENEAVCRPDHPRERQLGADASCFPTRPLPAEVKHGPRLCFRPGYKFQPGVQRS